jgi:long-chain acyl-CoA synthetase
VRIGDCDELLIKSPAVMRGYWNQARATSQAIDADGWLHTGDQVRMERGHIVITGRLKEVIVLSNGEKVAPADIEMAILMDGLFSQVLLIGEGRPYLTALVVLEPDLYTQLAENVGLDPDSPGEEPNPRLEAILTERVGNLLRSFPGYAKIPRIAVVKGPWSIENGLLTPTLKLKRSVILTKYGETVERLYEGHS